MDKKAFDLAVRYLSYRSRSQKEIRDYLNGKGYSSREIQTAIDKLHQYGYQSDESFGKEFVRIKGEGGKKGSRFVSAKLKEKGIEEELVEKIINEEYPPEKELLIAQDEGYRYFHSHRALPMNLLLNKLYQRLMGKGFTHGAIHHTLETLKNDPEVRKAIDEMVDVHYEKALEEAQKVLRKRERKDETHYKKRGAVYSSLLRKGFTSEVIKRVQETLEDE